MKFNFSLDAALIITALTALLYLVAQVFLAGYISIFGADITVLNLTVQDKLYYGFLKSLVHTLYFTLALFYFLLLYLLSLIILEAIYGSIKNYKI